MIPKPLYEILPGIYILGGILSLVINDSSLRYFPAVLLFITAAMVIYMRYEFRHLSPRERAQRMMSKH